MYLKKGVYRALDFYRSFIPTFSILATPHITLKKYTRFRRTEDCKWFFDTLKEQLTAIPLLAYPNLNKPMVQYTDASYQCIRTCLTQPCPERDGPNKIPEEMPIYFLSDRLSLSSSSLEVTCDWEGCYNVCLRKFKLLSGPTFIIKTDHKPFQYLFETEWKNKKIQQRVLKLSGYKSTWRVEKIRVHTYLCYIIKVMIFFI